MGVTGGNKKRKGKAPVRRGSGPRLESKPKPKAKPKTGSGIAPNKYKPRHLRQGGSKPRRKQTGKPSLLRRLMTRKNFMRFLSLMFTFAFLLIGFLLYAARDLPSIAGLDTIVRRPGITMKTADGLIIGTYGDVYGEYIPYDQLPPHLINAVLATEDRGFFYHLGIDPLGIMRAMIANLRAGRVVQGGSTITQQVAKNVFLTPERSIERKIQEMLLSFWVEARYSKEEILAIYLNRMYMGSGTYGVDAAAERDFGNSAREVNLVEAALLAGLLKAPSRYAPTVNEELAKKRAHQVLLNMVDAGLLAENQIEPALEAYQPTESYREGNASGSRYFTDWLADQIPLYIGNFEEDVIVTTTFNAEKQRLAEEALEKILDENGEAKQVSQAAVVSMAPDGAVQAVVGGRDYRKSQYNRATQAERQAGSTFKLMVYLAALEAGATPEMMVEDKPVEVELYNGQFWRPTNFTNDYKGVMPMRDALKQSLNTVAVQLSQAVGVDKVARMARRLGIDGVEPTPSIALGAVDVTLMEITAAFAHLANDGRAVIPYGITEITTKDGQELYKRESTGLFVVLSDSVVEMMNNMLLEVVRSGTGRRAGIGRPAAGKTGTSGDYRDAWFIGFTPQLVTGVWVGNDDNSPTAKVTGGNLPAMIWSSYMQPALEGEPERGIINRSEPAPVSLPWQQPSSDSVWGVIDGSNDAPSDRPVRLERSFWDKLMGGEPREIERDYPNSSPRERGINR